MIPDVVVWVGTAANKVECNTLSVSILHGRDDALTQPNASTATISLYGPLPPEAILGAAVGIDAIIGSTSYPRFRGEVSDLQVEWDSVDVPIPQIIATGKLGRIARRIVGGSPFPVELDGERVNRVLDLAGYTPVPALTDPGTVLVLARDVDRQPALSVSHDAALDGAGVVWQDLLGRMRYADALHRRGTPIAIEFGACDIGIGLTWRQSLEGLVNQARVRWGVTPEGGEQEEVTASHPESISKRGRYEESLTTRIENETDAQRRADEIIMRQGEPSWVVEGVEVNLAGFDSTDIETIMAMDMHSLLSLTGLPAGSPATSALVWVEGWREQIRGEDGGTISWVVDFATSDYCRSGAPPRWDDVTTEQTWDALPSDLKWSDAFCVPPQPARGRWHDVAASLRWDQIQDTVTWDTWA